MTTPNAMWVGAGIVLVGAIAGVAYLAGKAGSAQEARALAAKAEAGRAEAAHRAALAPPPGAKIQPGRQPGGMPPAPRAAAGLGSLPATPRMRGSDGALPPAGAAGGLDPAAVRATIDDLKAALAANDFDRMGQAEARLRAFLGGDEKNAKLLLEMLRGETDPAICAVLGGVLASDPAATGSAEITAAMAALAADGNAPQPQREQALAFLAQSTVNDPSIDRRLAELAREGDAAFRQAALGALSTRANAVPPERAAEVVPALVRAVAGERDEQVRAAFMASIPLRNGPASAVNDVVAALRNDGSAAVRQSAAHALGDAPGASRGAVTAELEAAFRAESDRDARAAILVALVRLLGPGALAPIERVRPIAGSARPDCDDYIEVLRSGETQADRIFEMKFAREVARGGPAGDAAHDHRD